MAIARLSVGIGKKGKAAPHAAYIAREGKYAKPDDDLEKLEFTGYGNMPEWAKTEPSFFWKMSDAHERQNGSAYREHVIALPRELKPKQRHDLILDWIEQELGDRHAYQYAIHNPTALDGGEQPHCHLMFSERTIDGISRDPDQYFKRYNSKNPEKGGSKKANTGMKPADRKADLIAQRERWEQTCNKHLEQAGRKARINMKSYKAQGKGKDHLVPFNFPMAQFNRPDIKQIYRDKLDARRGWISAARERATINIREEIDRLTEDAERQAAPIVEPVVEPVVRKLDTPTKMPVVKIGGSRLSSELDELHQRHDLIADKIDNGEMYEREGRRACEDFFITTQRTCEALDNAICRVPDKYDMEKYEAVYDAVDRLMGSMEQRMEDVGLKGVNEHTDATDKLQAMRQTLDKHTARIGLPTQRQQQPTPQNTPSPR